MRQEDSWTYHFTEIMRYMQKNKRRPSKYLPEERKMHHWLKHNKKLLNQGMLPLHRAEQFKQLLEMAESYRRLNQYAYKNTL